MCPGSSPSSAGDIALPRMETLAIIGFRAPGVRGGYPLHPPLASFFIGVFWSPLGLPGAESLLPVCHLPAPRRFLCSLTVCFLLPDLMCVSSLVAVFPSVSVLFVSVTSRDRFSSRAASGGACRAEAGGCEEPAAAAALLRQRLGFLPLALPHSSVEKGHLSTRTHMPGALRCLGS